MQGDEKHAGYNLPPPAALNNAASPHISKVSPNVCPQFSQGYLPYIIKLLLRTTYIFILNDSNVQ